MVVGCIALLLVACGSAERSPTPAPVEPSTRAEAPEPAPEPRRHQWRFAVDEAHFEVVDLGMTDALALPEGATLSINGGFFDRHGNAEGWVVSDGRELSAYRRELGGGVLVVNEGRARLFDGEVFEVPAANPDFAIQAKPRLVVDGQLNIRSETGRRAARTVLCIRDEGRTLEVVVASAGEGAGPTLMELGRELAQDGCEEALNLDGGPSTGFVAQSGSSMPRGPLRHAVVVRMETREIR